MLLTCALLFLLWTIYLCRPGRDIDSKGIYSCCHRGWRRIAFWAGDVRVLKSFPFITWDTEGYAIGPDEWLTAVKKARPGDVILGTKNGFFLSNSAIPGLFKHAAIFVEGPRCVWFTEGEFHDDTHKSRLLEICDILQARIVEAESEGVLERHPIYTLADKMIILRPKGVSSRDIERAVKTVRRVVGCDYDANFDFNIEEEIKDLEKRKTHVLYHSNPVLVQQQQKNCDKDIEELKTTSTNIKADFDHAFSCTETVALAWWHKRRELHLYRRRSRGRNVIVADQFVNSGFEVVWTNVTVDAAHKAGLDEESCAILKDYWDAQKEA